MVPDQTGGGRLRRLDDTGRAAGPIEDATDLARVEVPPDARWLWPAAHGCYPRLLRAGRRVERCHDLELTEALLLGYEGHWGQPRGLAAAWARLTGRPVPRDPPPPVAVPPGSGQGTLFDTDPAPPVLPGVDPLDAVVEVYARQQERLDTLAGSPAATRRLRLLTTAESAGALIAAEMGHAGLPWRADVHDALLLDQLGEPSPVGGPPRRLAELAARIADAFGGVRVHPDSPAEVLRAFARQGIPLPSTRAHVLRSVDHPAAPLLLEYKELYRIWTAHGWAWRHAWVRDGRFHPEYVPGGVVSGRWATRGGGALQIPRAVRDAVRADPGWKLVVADAGQLEPRILAAVSGDAGMARAAGAGDMYAALATEAFGGDRAQAKVALLGAMYGQTGGKAVPALAALRHRYPVALSYVEDAARVGETGGLVRTWLGRTCPPASAGWDERALAAGRSGPEWEDEPAAGPVSGDARARGRFTRNFVIQGTAAEWALVLLGYLRARLACTGAELVFFQHDEVVVHCRQEQAESVVDATVAAGERTRRLLFADTPVRFPLDVSVVDSYADAK